MTTELPEGTVTVLFTDVEGSTELASTRGDEAARELMRACDELCRQLVARHNGREVKGLGDGLMVAFTSARRAVQCAVEIQRALEERNRARPENAVRLRIGLHTGEVIREQADLFGSTVNAAARIQGLARPGEILVSEALRMVLGSGSGTELLERGEFPLKGFVEPWRLYEVTWARDAGPAPLVGRRTPFAGREAESTELRQLLDAARAGNGSLALIGGEPGVGKTRLAEELIGEARARGFRALVGHCYETEGAPPYVPFVEILEETTRLLGPVAFREGLEEHAAQAARIMPELHRMFTDIPPPPQLPPEQDRRYLLNSLRDYFARLAAASPLLLVLEDLHWADESTLLLIRHLAQRIGALPLLMVGTYRDTDLDTTRPLAAALPDLIRLAPTSDMNLERLPRGAVLAMLRSYGPGDPPAALFDLIMRETEGNPFFVEQVIKHLVEVGKLFDATGRWRDDVKVGEDEVPRGVRLAIGRRLERTSDVCRRVLSSAAIVGHAFTYELLEKLVDLDEDSLLDAIDEAERQRLIASEVVSGVALISFAHEQIRQTLLSGLSLPRRQRLHLKVADALEAMAGASGGVPASDIAHHLYQAGAAVDADRTVRWLSLAGDTAMAAAGFAQALSFYDQALSLPSEDPRGRAELLFRRGIALRSMHGWRQDPVDWDEALDIYESLGDVEAVGNLCYEMAKQLGYGGRFEEVFAVVERGLGYIADRRTRAGPLLAAVGAMMASCAPPPSGVYEDAQAALDSALSAAGNVADPSVEGGVLREKSAHDLTWGQWAALVDDRRGVGLLDSAGLLFDALVLRSWTLPGLLALGQVTECIDEGVHAEREANRLGISEAWTAGKWTASQATLLREGDLRAYERTMRELVTYSEGQPVLLPLAVAHLGFAAFWLGSWDEAAVLFERAREFEAASSMAMGVGSGPLILHAAYHGQRDAALHLLDEVAEMLPVQGKPSAWGTHLLLSSAIEGLAVLGEYERAAQLYGPAAELVQRGTIVEHALLARLPGAIAAACGERWDEAEEHFQVALRQAHDLPHRIAQPEVRRWHAWMCLERNASGDREQAAGLLAEAGEMYRRLGMPRHLELAEALLARANA